MDKKPVNNSRGAPPNKKQINNVVKNLKKTAFGYKNMLYFRLKITQGLWLSQCPLSH
jgi:hypothetical protein